ncbi:glycosyltransferase family 4 protein [Novosphingobium sp. FKTRR1]|uniref:glycosyltransferase family 4 protein n=1 Tax=Novosphingobium sp. FKTRR1 TaxID=2879118 RepID=UPI001CF08C62|nr:glycosyltransferase family 4 protein [Novosphingobium sp. FKTRR1]
MTAALFISHTAEMGGAELFLVDVLRDGPQDWTGGFLRDGGAAMALRDAGRPPLIVHAGKSLFEVRRESGLLSGLASATAIFAAARELARRAKNFDVICANSQKALVVCSIAAKLARKPLVWILHDIITDPAFSPTNRKVAIFLANSFADRVIVNSQPSLDGFVEAGGKAAKATIVYNGFDIKGRPRWSKSCADALRTQFGFSDKPVVGIFGRLAPWKGQHVFLNALAQLPDAQGLIVGSALFGHDDYADELREQVKSLGLSDRVHFAGFRDDVSILMAGCDAIVHASVADEPFGRVVVEAMLAEVPIVATLGGAVGDIINDGTTGWIVPRNDATALAAVLTSILDDPTVARQVASCGRIDAARRFDIAQTRSRIAAVLNEVACR